MGGIIANICVRFRWAVCQIDVLQRLNHTREAVRKALADLPKTLDETYDRLFLTIPEDDRSIVHHVLQWIGIHNERKPDNIPCALLLQAVAKSTASERYLDRDALRELCGCLISIQLEDAKSGRLKRTHFTVSYAHYTVSEYLDSIRISKTANASFSAYQEDVRIHCIELVLNETLHVQPNELWERDAIPNDDLEVWRALEDDFNTFSIECTFSFLQSTWFGISRYDVLCALVFDLMDPSKSNFQLLIAACRVIESTTNTFANSGWDENDYFWLVSWDTPFSNTEAVQLLNLLLLSSTSEEALILAGKFLETRDIDSILQAPLHFTSPSWVFGEVGNMKAFPLHHSKIQSSPL